MLETHLYTTNADQYKHIRLLFIKNGKIKLCGKSRTSDTMKQVSEVFFENQVYRFFFHAGDSWNQHVMRPFFFFLVLFEKLTNKYIFPLIVCLVVCKTWGMK